MVNGPIIPWVLISLLQCVYSSYDTYNIENKCAFEDGLLIHVLPTTNGPNSAVILKATSNSTYKPDRHCTVCLLPPFALQNGIVFNLLNIDFAEKDYRSVFYPCKSYIQIWRHTEPICEIQEKTVYRGFGELTLTYHTAHTVLGTGSGFEAVVTAFSTPPCERGQFQCGNHQCIWEGLICDGYNNCGDNSDENKTMCFSEYHTDQEKMFLSSNLLVLAISVVSICVMVTFISLLCHFKKKRTDLSIYCISSEGGSRTPYEAMYPARFSISKNPAGPLRLYSPPNSALWKHDFGISNPCYPHGIPQLHHPNPTEKII